ncbi:MAG: hypothetical protein KA383_17630 [Phycisphaerae bacterium]|nr:hypothetical protein [Phycisphaerae bacterium]HQL55087.1 hypothetical protein [Phycisphaerae bacterium]
MKQMFVGGAVLVLLVGGLVAYGVRHLRAQFSGAEGFPVGFALGNAGSNSIELHVAVTHDMVKADPPTITPNGVLLWNEWVPQHFELRDAAGQSVRLNRAGTSVVINERKAFNPEFYLVARLTPGTTYSLDYIPYVGENKRHRHTFTATAAEQPFQRLIFETIRTAPPRSAP